MEAANFVQHITCIIKNKLQVTMNYWQLTKTAVIALPYLENIKVLKKNILIVDTLLINALLLS